MVDACGPRTAEFEALGNGFWDIGIGVFECFWGFIGGEDTAQRQ
jgi:hypothetical protein